MSALGSETRQYTNEATTGGDPVDLVAEFWQQWEEHRDVLYRCCLRMMNYNQIDAEDALSQACLKAWEKLHKFAGKISNLKDWLFKLTSNLCVDIIRKRSRDASAVESIEWTNPTETIAMALVETPELALEEEEKYNEIRRAIADLPQTLRDTFVLHFYQERTHKEIAQEQGISYDNTCQRISQARKKLKEKLSGYFLGEQEEPSPVALARSQSPIPPAREEKQKTIEPEKKKALEVSANGSAIAIAPIPPALGEKQKTIKLEEKKALEVSANGSARSQLPTPLPPRETQKDRNLHANTLYRTRNAYLTPYLALGTAICISPEDDLTAKETATVSATRECLSVAVSPWQTLRERLRSPQVVTEKPLSVLLSSQEMDWRKKFIASVGGEL